MSKDRDLEELRRLVEEQPQTKLGKIRNWMISAFYRAEERQYPFETGAITLSSFAKRYTEFVDGEEFVNSVKKVTSHPAYKAALLQAFPGPPPAWYPLYADYVHALDGMDGPESYEDAMARWKYYWDEVERCEREFSGEKLREMLLLARDEDDWQKDQNVRAQEMRARGETPEGHAENFRGLAGPRRVCPSRCHDAAGVRVLTFVTTTDDAASAERNGRAGRG